MIIRAKLIKNDFSSFNHFFNEVCSKPVAQVAVIRDIQDEQIRLLAGFQGADAVRPVDGGGGVDRGGGDGLRRSEPHIPAGQGDGELHAFAPGGARVEVGRQGHDAARLQDGFHWRVTGFRQTERRARQRHGDGPAPSQGRDIIWGDGDQVVCGGGA